MAEDYIGQFYDWSTDDAITAARLDGNVTNITNGLSGGAKAINVGKILMNGATCITSARVATFTDLTVDNISIDANTISADTGNVIIGSLTQSDNTAGLTAGTTQTQAGGLALTSNINEISTVANADDTVVLPTAVAGLEVTILNNGANTLRIYPASSDDLGNGADTFGRLASGDNITFIAIDATTWEPTTPFQEVVLTSAEWNMDTTASINVAHGLAILKLRSVVSHIINNAVDDLRDLEGGDASGNTLGKVVADGTNAVLTRIAARDFDAAGWNAATAYVTVRYII